MKRGVTGRPASSITDSECTVVVLQGVLDKVSKIGFNSRKLCVLTKSEFFYYSDHKARGSVKHVSLQDVQAVKRDHSSKGFQFEIITHHKTETFAADSLEICQQWLKAIQSTLLTNRRISVSSANSGGMESTRSPVAKYGGHPYEEVDIDDEGPKIASGKNSSQPDMPTFKLHAYETVDLDDEDKPKIDNPKEDKPNIDNPKEDKPKIDKPKEDKPKIKPATRGVCSTVDALGGPPDTVLSQGNPSTQPKSSEKHNLAPISSDSHKPARGMESTRSPVAKYGGHPNEEVDIDDEGPKIASGKNSSQPDMPTFKLHAYETVDLDDEDKPKIDNPKEDEPNIDNPKEDKPKIDKPKEDKPKIKPATRGVCSTVDALGGPPDTVLSQGNPSTQPKSSEKHNLAPISSDSHKPARLKTPPPLLPKPSLIPKSPGHENRPIPAPRNRGVCMTVDTLRGPPGTTPGNMSPTESQPEEPPLYSEVMPKRSDLYTECKKLKEEQGERRQEGEKGKPAGSADGNVGNSGYSEAYVSVDQPIEGLYSQVSKVKTRKEEITQSGIYSLAKDICADVLPASASRPPASTPPTSNTSVSTPPTSRPPVSTPPTSNTSVSTPPTSTTPVSTPPLSTTALPTPATPTKVVSTTPAPSPLSANVRTSTPAVLTAQPEEIYNDAMSCQSSEQQANPGSVPQAADDTDELTMNSANSNTLKDVNSNAIPIASLCYGPMTRHDAINKLDQFLSARGKV
ncbi:uncharacterized protein LOC135475980 isoform X1 [Liolophura sinensis]|uniref:uncharacterized protein LOC135475980 isoform X1 n=1 Tax=Liolophura sinensis TaxID=3198878 RepID=UPI003159580D